MSSTPQGDGAAQPADLAAPDRPAPDRLGVAIVGLGGAVATTAVAGVELIRQQAVGLDGLPLAALDNGLTRDLVGYGDLVFGGWDLYSGDLAAAARHHGVLDLGQYEAAREALAETTPWPAYGDDAFCKGVTGDHCQSAGLGLRAVVYELRRNLRDFQAENGLDRAVVINLASTESSPDLDADVFQTAEAFEAAVDADDRRVPPAMLYAYAAILEGVPYGNFTPSVGADVPALVALAERHAVPLAGKDGKTGQTFLKTLMAPGLRDRALRVEGWFSTNILGNRDGEALREAGSLKSKIDTKGSVLDQILGYDVEDHVVRINYYRPRGDAKEAWDNIDLVGFLGQRMQVKVNFLCRDSILAAPLVLEIARCLDLASRSGEGGVMEPMGVFFKGPMTAGGRVPEHDFGKQQAAFLAWLGALIPTETADATAAEAA
jgi:myo-inositol-1-phosphate synthase